MCEEPFREYEFHGYTGERCTVSFGWHYAFSGRQPLKADDVPDWARSPAVAPRESLSRPQPPREPRSCGISSRSRKKNGSGSVSLLGVAA